MTRDGGSERPSRDGSTGGQLAAAGDAAPDEYRYRP